LTQEKNIIHPFIKVLFLVTAAILDGIWTYLIQYAVFQSRCIRYKLCDNIGQWLAADLWFFSPGTLVTSTNKTDRYDTTEILLNVVLNTINPNHSMDQICSYNLYYYCLISQSRPCLLDKSTNKPNQTSKWGLYTPLLVTKSLAAQLI
jgi:hypothetical protein